MKLSRFLLAALAGVALCVACDDDDDDDTTYDTLDGSLSVGAEIPAFVNPGDTFHFESTGVSVPEDAEDPTVEIVYTYTNSESSTTDTTTVYDVVIPDIIGEYTVTAKAAASGFYTKTVTLSTVVISDDSFTDADKSGLSTFTDQRDKRTYHYTTMNGKTWMSDNLAYFEKDADGNYTLGMSYEEAAAGEIYFGGFYSWEDAQNACPSGWKLPTKEDWEALGEASGPHMCDAYYNETRLWEFWPDVKITNSLNFFAFPFGYATIVDGEYTFTGFNDYAFFWADNAGEPMCRYIYVQSATMSNWDSPSKTDFAAQIRCVRE